MQPVTINGGAAMPAWYDITSLEEGDENREDRQGWNTDPQNCFHVRTGVADS
jgi:hypothetical protein